MSIDFKNIKEPKISMMSKRKLNNLEAFTEMKKKDSKIISKIKKCFESGGFVYYFEYKNVIKAIFIFEVVERNIILGYDLMSEDIEYNDRYIVENGVIDEIQERISKEDFEMIRWKDRKIVPKKDRFGKYSFILGVTIFVFGLILGAIFGNVALGFCFGVCLGTAAAAVTIDK